MDPSPKRQKLLSKACEACRSRKAKCDSAVPSCEPCLRRGVECVYREREQPGLRPGFGKSLEQRLTRMEGSLEQIRHLLQGNGPAQNSQALNNNYDASQSGSTRAISMPLDSALYIDDTTLPISPGADNIYHGYAGPEMPDGLPSRDLLQRLSSLYFEFAYPWMNFLSPPDVEAQVFNHSQLVTLHCITLLGFRYWGEVEPSLEVQQRYMENSRQHLLAVAMDEISFTSTQALATLALDALGQGPSSRTLNIMSLLHTATTQLDLAQQAHESEKGKPARMVRNPARDTDGDKARTEDRSQGARLFWTVYTLDRIISVSHGLGCKIAPNFFSREGLAVEKISTPVARIEALVDDVITLIERVNEFIIRPVDLSDPDESRQWKNHFRALDTALRTWRESQLADSRALGRPDAIEITAHAMYHVSIIRMHSVAAFPPRTSSLNAASPLAPGRCHQAVKSICGICEMLKPEDFSKMSPLFVFAVWVASRNMVTLWTSGWEEQTPAIPPELTTLRNSLHAMAIYWPCAEKFSSMIDFVMDLTGKTNRYSMLAVFNDVSHTAYGLHDVLGPRIKQDRDMEMAQLWDSFAIPGLDEINPFI